MSLLVTLGFAWGQYALAPNGQYALGGIGTPSHNPATYHWFFQGWFSLEAMLFGGLFAAFFYLIVTLPIGIAAGIALGCVPQLAFVARAWIGMKRTRLLFIVLAAWVVGAILTIVNGLNPGLCC